MKTALFCICVFLTSCTSPNIKQQPIVVHENKVDSLMRYFTSQYQQQPNEMQKKDFKESFLKLVNKTFSDSMHFHMGNIPVTVQQVTNTYVGSVKAFYVTFKDKAGNDYFTEFDYPNTDDTSLFKNPAYQLLKNIPENTDTVFSFFYMGQVEWQGNFDDKLKFQVIPFPINFNFDSSKLANNKSKKLKKK